MPPIEGLILSHATCSGSVITENVKNLEIINSKHYGSEQDINYIKHKNPHIFNMRYTQIAEIEYRYNTVFLKYLQGNKRINDEVINELKMGKYAQHFEAYNDLEIVGMVEEVKKNLSC